MNKYYMAPKRLYIWILAIVAVVPLLYLAAATKHVAEPIPSPSSETGLVTLTDDPKWYRYTDAKNNFEVLSLDDARGKYLYENADIIKAWALTRWALPNDNFPIKCKLIAVQNRATFKEYFGKDAPQYRVTKDSSGQIREVVIWIALDDPRWHTQHLSKMVTEVSLQNFEAKHSVKLGYWAHRGMGTLNSDLPTIRQTLGNTNLIFQKDIKVYWSKELLSMTPEILSKHPAESSAWYDNQAAAFCLMLWKEHGSKKFNDFLLLSAAGNPEGALATVYGFKSYDDCDQVYKKYLFDLSNDLTGRGTKVTPNSALTWPVP